jgi:hypothetical protein
MIAFYFYPSNYNHLDAVSYESPVFSKYFKTSFTVSPVHVHYVNIKLQGIK